MTPREIIPRAAIETLVADAITAIRADGAEATLGHVKTRIVHEIARRFSVNASEVWAGDREHLAERITAMTAGQTRAWAVVIEVFEAAR